MATQTRAPSTRGPPLPRGLAWPTRRDRPRVWGETSGSVVLPQAAWARVGKRETRGRRGQVACAPGPLRLPGAERRRQAHVACSCLYFYHLTPILDASKCHYTFL